MTKALEKKRFCSSVVLGLGVIAMSGQVQAQYFGNPVPPNLEFPDADAFECGEIRRFLSNCTLETEETVEADPAAPNAED